MAAYGVAPKLLRRWCKIYSEHGEAGLQPKKRGRQLGAKQKPVQELPPMEKLELRIKQLEAENAILRKLFKKPCSQAELNKIVPFGFSLQRQKNGVFLPLK